MTNAQANTCNSELVWILAGALTPTTIAAVLADLEVNDQPTERLDKLQNEVIARALADQLFCMVGEDEAANLMKEARGVQ